MTVERARTYMTAVKPARTSTTGARADPRCSSTNTPNTRTRVLHTNRMWKGVSHLVASWRLWSEVTGEGNIVVRVDGRRREGKKKRDIVVGEKGRRWSRKWMQRRLFVRNGVVSLEFPVQLNVAVHGVGMRFGG